MATGYEDLLPTATTGVSGYEDLITIKPLVKQQPTNSLGQFLRSAASLADVTVGGVLPAAAQMVGYPIARLGRSPEAAQAATQRIVSAVDKPFGKMAGVTETPEYQGEAGRQLLNFIGENFQKGAKFIAEKTGLPVADVESYMGTLSVAAPAVARPAARTIQELAVPAIEKAVVGVKMPFEPMVQARRERMSLEDYARGPQIDALTEAKRLGIAISPEQIQPTLVPKTLSTIAGEQGLKAITDVNKNQVRKVVLNDLGLPETTQLDSKTPFSNARLKVSKPYVEVRKLPIQQADDAMIQRLEAVRADLDVIGAKEYAPAISKIVDDAIAKTQTGLTGDKLLKNISVLRQRARKTYDNKSATTEALDIADTNLKIATELESMIDSSIFNPKLLGEYRAARQQMAKTYAYEAATDFNTGMIDVNKLSRITAKDNAMTGDIAALGKIAGNFPDAFAVKPSKGFADTPRIARASIGGATGVAIGSQFGAGGAALGGLLGTLAGEGAGSLASRIIASPKYQEALALRDARIPVSQVATAAQPIPQSQAIVPYQAPVEVLGQGEGPYQPNFVIQPNQYEPRVTTPGFAPTPPQLPSPSAQGTISGLRAEDVRRAGISRTLGQQAEAQQAAVEAATRQPARGGVEYVIDVGGNLVEAPIGGQPKTLAPSALESAIAKMSGQVVPETSTLFRTQTISPKTGAKPYTRITKKEGETTFERGVNQAFLMTAEEKIAWNKVKADLAEVVPGMKTLSNESILNRIQDREWATNAVQKAREKADSLVRQEALLTEQLANRNNLRLMAKEIEDKQKQLAKVKADKERMMNLAEQMEETLGLPRPDVSRKQQGPKTRAAFREGLFTNPQPFKMEIRGTNRLLSGD